MTRILILCGVLLTLASSAAGQRAATFEDLTVSTASVGIAATTIRPAGQGLQNNFCTLYVDGANLRYRFDGTAPTTSVGVVASNGETISIDNTEQAVAIRFIRDDATDVSLQIHCWRQPVTG